MTVRGAVCLHRSFVFTISHLFFFAQRINSFFPLIAPSKNSQAASPTALWSHTHRYDAWHKPRHISLFFFCQCFHRTAADLVLDSLLLWRKMWWSQAAALISSYSWLMLSAAPKKRLPLSFFAIQPVGLIGRDASVRTYVRTCPREKPLSVMTIAELMIKYHEH